MTFVRTADVDWAEVDGSAIRLHVGRETHVVRETMAEFEQRVPSSRFLRIHRSTIVHIAKIREVQPLTHGDHAVVLRDGKVLRVARSRRDALARALGVTL